MVAIGNCFYFSSFVVQSESQQVGGERMEPRAWDAHMALCPQGRANCACQSQEKGGLPGPPHRQASPAAASPLPKLPCVLVSKTPVLRHMDPRADSWLGHLAATQPHVTSQCLNFLTGQLEMTSIPIPKSRLGTHKLTS